MRCTYSVSRPGSPQTATMPSSRDNPAAHSSTKLTAILVVLLCFGFVALLLVHQDLGQQLGRIGKKIHSSLTIVNHESAKVQQSGDCGDSYAVTSLQYCCHCSTDSMVVCDGVGHLSGSSAEDQQDGSESLRPDEETLDLSDSQFFGSSTKGQDLSRNGQSNLAAQGSPVPGMLSRVTRVWNLDCTSWWKAKCFNYTGAYGSLENEFMQLATIERMRSRGGEVKVSTTTSETPPSTSPGSRRTTASSLDRRKRAVLPQPGASPRIRRNPLTGISHAAEPEEEQVRQIKAKRVKNGDTLVTFSLVGEVVSDVSAAVVYTELGLQGMEDMDTKVDILLNWLTTAYDNIEPNLKKAYNDKYKARSGGKSLLEAAKSKLERHKARLADLKMLTHTLSPDPDAEAQFNHIYRTKGYTRTVKRDLEQVPETLKSPIQNRHWVGPFGNQRRKKNITLTKQLTKRAPLAAAYMTVKGLGILMSLF